MFEEGNLLLFHPFLFKNGAPSKDKFFLVLEKTDDDLLLASLPTSKDHVPSDVEVKHGCLDLSERFVNVLPQFGIKKIGLEFGSLQYYSYLCSCKSISYEQ